MKEKLCKNCEHWFRGTRGAYVYPWNDGKVFSSDCAVIEDTPTSGAGVRSYEGVTTEENFGCIHFKDQT